MSPNRGRISWSVVFQLVATIAMFIFPLLVVALAIVLTLLGQEVP